MKRLTYTMKMQYQYIFETKRIIIALLMICGIYYIGVVQEKLFNPLYEMLDVLFLFDYISSTGVFIPLLSIAVVYSVGHLYSENHISGFAKMILVRTTKKCYFRTLALVYVTIPCITMWLSMLLLMCSLSLTHPLVKIEQAAYESHLGSYQNGLISNQFYFVSEILVKNNIYLYLITVVFLMGLISSLWGMISFGIAVWTKNGFVATIAPFLLYYIEEIVCYFLNLRLFRIRTIMWGNYNVSSSIILNLFFAIGWVCLCNIVIYKVALIKYERDEQNE